MFVNFVFIGRIYDYLLVSILFVQERILPCLKLNAEFFYSICSVYKLEFGVTNVYLILIMWEVWAMIFWCFREIFMCAYTWFHLCNM